MKKFMLIAMLSLFAFANNANAYTRCSCYNYFEGGRYWETIWYQSESYPNCNSYLWEPIDFYIGTVYSYDAGGSLIGFWDFYQPYWLNDLCIGVAG